MTKVSENTSIVVRAGVVIGVIGSLGVWFNTRLSAMEVQNIEDKKDIQFIRESVSEMKDILKELRNKP